MAIVAQSVSASESGADPGRAPDEDLSPSINPATGELLGFHAVQQAVDVRAAVERARSAQPAWAALPVETRADCVLRVRDYVVDNADELARVIAEDSGKTRTDAMLTEVLTSAAAATYYARNARGFLAERWVRPSTGLLAYKVSKIARVPFGVVGIISPWNYPFAIPFSEVVMALLAGNGVVLKTASQTQRVGHALAHAFTGAGLPSGIFSHVNLPGRIAGRAFLGAGIDKLFFTGSVGVGKGLMALAADTLTPVSLELGGNDAMLVCPDADLERAAAGAVWAGMQNAGQTCGGVERIYVHRAVYEPFLELLAERVKKLRVGPDADFDVDMGAMTTAEQSATVRAHVRDAIEGGARLYARSECPVADEGTFLPAMVLTDVAQDMRVMQEETFGPVVAVMAVDSMNQAVALANDSSLGLTGSVWSRDRRRAEALARRIQAGAVTINDHLVSNGLPETPWGGVKESGIGRTHGELGFAEMTQPQVLVSDYLPGARGNLWWYPHGREVYNGLRGMLDLLYARGVGRKLKGLMDLTRLLPRMFGANR
ncbi:MAG: aldehyde dehydrogenase family protein [bacterium]